MNTRRIFVLAVVGVVFSLLLVLLTGCSGGATLQDPDADGTRPYEEIMHSSPGVKYKDGELVEESGAGAKSDADTAERQKTERQSESSQEGTAGESTVAPAAEGKTESDDFILPDADKRVYYESQLEKLGDHELFLARNELFARHGVVFGDDELDGYFGGKSWYAQISQKTHDIKAGMLNLVENSNAMAIRRIEQKRGSSYVKELDSSRTAMHEAYSGKVDEYEREYGQGGLVKTEDAIALTGLCLVQLVDFEKDGWEELLLAYSFDGSADSRQPDTEAYTYEVWSFEGGDLSLVSKGDAMHTQSHGSFLLIGEDANGRAIGEKSGRDLLYCYQLSLVDNPAAGDRYWINTADVFLNCEQVQGLTTETRRILGERDPGYALDCEYMMGQWTLGLSGSSDATSSSSVFNPSVTVKSIDSSTHDMTLDISFEGVEPDSKGRPVPKHIEMRDVVLNAHSPGQDTSALLQSGVNSIRVFYDANEPTKIRFSTPDYSGSNSASMYWEEYDVVWR